MSEFQSLQEQWGRELQKKGDISDSIHKIFLGRLQKILRENPKTTDIPEANFYIQAEAGFYRFRILEVLDTKGNIFQVNFHVFQEGETHIHSHGYEGNSFVLDGGLSVINYQVREMEENEQGLYKLLQSENIREINVTPLFSKNPSTLKMGDIAQIASGAFQKYGIINIRAFMFLQVCIQKNIDILDMIEKDLEIVLATGSIPNISGWTIFFAQSVMGLEIRELARHMVQNGNIYEIFGVRKQLVLSGEKYSVGIQEAHKVIVPEHAVTLFLTKRQALTPLGGGEFHYFPQKDHKNTGIQNSEEHSPRKVLTHALLKLQI